MTTQYRSIKIAGDVFSLTYFCSGKKSGQGNVKLTICQVDDMIIKT